LFVFRGKLTLAGNVEPIHNVMDPVGLDIDLKRAFPPQLSELHYDISGKLRNVTVSIYVCTYAFYLGSLKIREEENRVRLQNHQTARNGREKKKFSICTMKRNTQESRFRSNSIVVSHNVETGYSGTCKDGCYFSVYIFVRLLKQCSRGISV
jgi:hypothetical protein